MMRTSELLEKLKSQVSDKELRMLEEKDPSIAISDFNREVIIELMGSSMTADGQVDEKRVELLDSITTKYLEEYLSDKPEAFKWIIISCKYLSFIKKLPLHPQFVVGYQIIEKEGKISYLCPARSTESGTSCDFCVCKRLNKEQ